MKNITHPIPLFLIALSSCLLGLSMILMGHNKAVQTTTDFYDISSQFSPALLNTIAAIAFMLCSVLCIISIFHHKAPRWLGAVLVTIAIVPLVTLLGQARWIDALGGFPAIGSGQGVIKYFALLAVGILLLMPELSKKTKQWLVLFPVLIVLIWIGGMKFTLLEAQGIEDLVASSPLMAWMYHVWDLQTTSNLIGIYDLIAVALLITAVYKQKLLLPAIVMSGAVFIVTQTFLISWQGALSDATILSSGGHFLIKDLWFLANLYIFWQLKHSDNKR